MKVIKAYYQKYYKSILTRLIILVHLIFSYNALPGWYYSLVGSLLIILISSKTWPNYTEWIGLIISKISIIFSVVLFIVTASLSYLLISTIASNNSVSLRFISFTVCIHIFGYTINEEMLIGSILLKYIQTKFANLKMHVISISVAVIFSLLHFVFYKWIFTDSGVLSLITFLSLIAVGVIRNNLIIGTGHIGYSWAIHAGWVFIMFGFDHQNSCTNQFLNESERFNLYLGNLYTLLFLFCFAVASFVLIRDSKNLTKKE